MKDARHEPSQFSLNPSGDFIITDYHDAKPFASFLPGIAGPEGIPMWVFYVNRGQGICSMGTRDKDRPIMEFLPANWAYQLVTGQGFRTFIKLPDHLSAHYYEPFQPARMPGEPERTQRMVIAPDRLVLEEENHGLDLRFTVEYSTVPQDSYAGLIRILRIQNLSAQSVTIEGLDGLPLIVPFGVNNFLLKNMRRTIEAFVEVCNLEAHAPFFRAKVEPADRPDVERITQGNFYVGFEPGESGVRLVDPVVDPWSVFGPQRDFGTPERFLADSDDAFAKHQIREGQFPSAMGRFVTSIPAGGTYTYTSIIGHASSLDALNQMLPRIACPEYVEDRVRVNRDTVDALTQSNLICSAAPALDHYARQNVLDNVMRGGFPVTLAGEKRRTTIHLYSRKHGDLERDYNDFCVMPTPYSQGNGNFRDINQNRRCDLFFNPAIGEENVAYFYNLIQLDGFNPLVLSPTRFRVVDRDGAHRVLAQFLPPAHIQAVRSYLDEPFSPGALLMALQEQNATLSAEPHDFLGQLLDHCHSVPETVHGEGYWTDHWTYNLDLLENFEAVYPDRMHDLLFGAGRFTFHNSPYVVKPRHEKYVLWQGKPAQLGAVVLDDAKAEAITRWGEDPECVRIDSGQGAIYRTSLFTKMLCLVVNKLASLDPEGVGVEMEAGKPGWYDALNGLPGLSGSSVSETLEIKRHILFLLGHLSGEAGHRLEIALFEELKELMDELQALLASGQSGFAFWDRATRAREQYRDRTRMGVSGREVTVSAGDIEAFFHTALNKLDSAIERARDPESGTLFTYFRYEVTDYETIDGTDAERVPNSQRDDHTVVHIKPLQFRQIPLPLFLEGPVHYLRCKPGIQAAREFASRVRESALFDAALKMYKVNASLADQPLEIGRAKVFSPGWLENESIWLHMEYKYLLELLRNELYTEFYDNLRSICIPFLDPAVYGRSILENCSFIASSAHPDPSVHGNGFVARLSGATAEFIHMLWLMTAGPRPFTMSPEGALQLRLEPALPDWLFTEAPNTIRLARDGRWEEVTLPARSFSFVFLGTTLVVYHNPDLRNTYGPDGVKPAQYRITYRSGNERTCDGEAVTGDPAEDIRDRKIARIDIQLRR